MAPRFDLVDIVQTLQRKAKFILIVTLAAAAIALIAKLVGTKMYKSTAEFFTSNPFYVDRTNIFPGDNSLFLDYFAKEEDIDKVVGIAKSDTMLKLLIVRMDLGKVYGMDMNDPRQQKMLMNEVEGHLEIKRTENSSVEISFTDKNPVSAANIANGAVAAISELYNDYFKSLHRGVEDALQTKKLEADSTIAVMTDSLVALRDRYGIYDIVSPNRKNMISGSTKGGGAGYGRGIEEVQNLESVKDQFVIDRARYISMMNEFNTGSKAGALPLIHVLSKADAPIKEKGLGLALTILVCAALGFFFSSLWVLIATYFKAVVNTQR